LHNPTVANVWDTVAGDPQDLNLGCRDCVLAGAEEIRRRLGLPEDVEIRINRDLLEAIAEEAAVPRAVRVLYGEAIDDTEWSCLVCDALVAVPAGARIVTVHGALQEVRLFLCRMCVTTKSDLPKRIRSRLEYEIGFTGEVTMDPKIPGFASKAPEVERVVEPSPWRGNPEEHTHEVPTPRKTRTSPLGETVTLLTLAHGGHCRSPGKRPKVGIVAGPREPGGTARTLCLRSGLPTTTVGDSARLMVTTTYADRERPSREGVTR
jgi:hypothetical protein